MALLEAMASRLPVVCSAIRGSCDLMEPVDEHGMLCKGGIMVEKADDSKAYADAFAKLLQAPDLLPQMSSANRERAKSFSSELVKERMQKIYNRILCSEDAGR